MGSQSDIPVTELDISHNLIHYPADSARPTQKSSKYCTTMYLHEAEKEGTRAALSIKSTRAIVWSQPTIGSRHIGSRNWRPFSSHRKLQLESSIWVDEMLWIPGQRLLLSVDGIALCFVEGSFLSDHSLRDRSLMECSLRDHLRSYHSLSDHLLSDHLLWVAETIHWI